ncbi:TPA: hypothetical protein EYP38_00830, partial [Candidatus Micrarchaeota archaeon]|nr:hypothetical protein [Candidatus Micrarchaeota archaeon]
VVEKEDRQKFADLISLLEQMECQVFNDDEVERAEWVKIEFFDRFGQKRVIETDGLLAIAFQQLIHQF